MAMTIRIVCFQVSSIVGPFVEVGEALASPVVSSFRHFHPMLDFCPCEYRLLALAFYSDLDGPPFSVFLEAVVECFVFHFLFPWVVRAATIAALLLGSEQLRSACLGFRTLQDFDARHAIRLDVH